jgi:hypothetical protein
MSLNTSRVDIKDKRLNRAASRALCTTPGSHGSLRRTSAFTIVSIGANLQLNGRQGYHLSIACLAFGDESAADARLMRFLPRAQMAKDSHFARNPGVDLLDNVTAFCR